MPRRWLRGLCEERRRLHPPDTAGSRRFWPVPTAPGQGPARPLTGAGGAPVTEATRQPGVRDKVWGPARRAAGSQQEMPPWGTHAGAGLSWRNHSPWEGPTLGGGGRVWGERNSREGLLGADSNPPFRSPSTSQGRGGGVGNEGVRGVEKGRSFRFCLYFSLSIYFNWQ